MAKWKKPDQAFTLIEKLSKHEIPPDEEKKYGLILSQVGYNTKFTQEYEALAGLILEEVAFSSEFPKLLGERIVAEAIFDAADNGRLNSGAVLENIKTAEKSYTGKKNKSYTLLTNISVAYGAYLKKIASKDATITFYKNVPNGFDVEELNEFSKKVFKNSDLASHFTYVKVSVQARCQESAHSLAKRELDFVRGIWNLTMNKGGIRYSSGIPDRVNKIYCGPCSAIYNENMRRESSTIWYDTHIVRKASVSNLSKDIEECKKNERFVRRLCRNDDYGRFIKNALVRYANALDYEDMEVTFLKLWSLLEYLTHTGFKTYDVTIHRAAQIYLDKSLMKMRLEVLRGKRNGIVHSDESYNSSETDAHVVLMFVNSMLRFFINHIQKIGSIERFIAFLDLPHSKEQYNLSRALAEEKAEIHNLVNDIRLYGR